MTSEAIAKPQRESAIEHAEPFPACPNGCGSPVYLYVAPNGWETWVHVHNRGVSCLDPNH